MTVPLRENDDSSSKVDVVDAIAKEIDMTWAIIAVIEILLREDGDDKYAQGCLSLAHAHLHGQKPRQPLCTRGGPSTPAPTVASSLSQPIGVGRGLTATRTSFSQEDRLFLPAAKKETAPSLLGFAPIQRIEGK
jgi:hypothetical protein